MKEKKESSTPKKGKKPEKNIEIKVKQEAELMKFLEENLPHKNRNNIKSLLKRKQVVVNGTAVKQFNYLLKPGNTVEISRRPSKSANQITGFVIVHEDKDLIVVNKNAGVYAVPTEREKQNTVFNMLSTYVKGQDKNSRIYTIQHLDRETSGLMVFSKSKEIQEAMKKAKFERSYQGVIEGKLEYSEGEYSSFLSLGRNYITESTQDGKEGDESTTHIKEMKSNESFSLVRLNPDSLFKNQVRAHLKDLGHPIIGDKKYGSKNNPIGRLGLHASEVIFTHPKSGKKMHLKTSTPGSFLRLF